MDTVIAIVLFALVILFVSNRVRVKKKKFKYLTPNVIVDKTELTIPKLKFKKSKIKSVYAKIEGTPYVWGGNKPEEGLDCSGMILYILRKTYKPDIKDMTANGIYKYLKKEPGWEPITDTNYKLGDIVFWTTKVRIYHIAIALNKDTFIEAAAAGMGRKLINLELSELRSKGKAKVKTSKFINRFKPPYVLRFVGEQKEK